MGPRGALGAATSSGAAASLQTAFAALADGEPAALSKAKFIRLVTSLRGEALAGAISRTDAGWVFDKVCAEGKKAIAFRTFEKAVDKLAVYKGLIVEDLRHGIVSAVDSPTAARPGASIENIRKAFALFDIDGSGTLTVDELVGIMTDHSTSHPMTMREATAFVARFDANHDGQLDLDEFASAMAMASGGAKSISPAASGGVESIGPPKGSGDLLLDTFRAFATFGKAGTAAEELEGATFAKLCQEARLIDKAFTRADVDLAFAKFKGKRTMSFEAFEHAMAHVAAKKKVDIDSLRSQVAAAAPKSSGTKAASGGVVGKLTDTSQYTGAHKERFDASGRGRGLDGRDRVAKGYGSTPTKVNPSLLKEV